MALENAPPPPAGDAGGGGAAEALAETNSRLTAIAQMMRANPQIPAEIKARFAAAADAYREGLEGVSSLAEGGGEMGADTGLVTPEQGGAPGVIPVTPAGVRARG